MGKSKYLKFWGTRGSCPVSGPEYARFGGNTSCLEVSYDDLMIIIDAGTGIRPLGESLSNRKQPLHLFLSHTHWDHVIGFPFFSPLYLPETVITIWSPSSNQESCKSAMEKLLSVEFFPVSLNQLKAKVQFRCPEVGVPCKVGPLTLHFHRTRHPSDAHCFIIETPRQKIGYVTDNEIFKDFHGDLQEAPDDPEFVHFLQGCDILIHEAQYFPEEYHEKVGWGHSSSINAAALLQKTKIGRWLVVHHDPKHTDADLDRLAASTQKLLDRHNISCRSEWIGDGHVIDLE